MTSHVWPHNDPATRLAYKSIETDDNIITSLKLSIMNINVSVSRYHQLLRSSFYAVSQ